MITIIIAVVAAVISAMLLWRFKLKSEQDALRAELERLDKETAALTDTLEKVDSEFFETMRASLTEFKRTLKKSMAAEEEEEEERRDAERLVLMIDRALAVAEQTKEFSKEATAEIQYELEKVTNKKNYKM